MYDNKTKETILANALIRILENQIQIRKHIGLIKDEGYYGDCYADNEIIDDLRNIEYRT